MKRSFSAAVVGLVFFVGALPALEAVGVLKKIDFDKNVLYIHAGGQNRTVDISKNVKVLGNDGKPLADGLRAKELKEGAEVTVTVEPENGKPTLMAIRLGKHPATTDMPLGGKDSVGFKPLTEMTDKDRYKGEDGGLYGGGRNEPPAAHQAAAAKQTAQILPLAADGKPAKDGKIVLISISMSNATQEFSFFKKIADEDTDKSTLLTIVDCAQGGQAMAEWVDPKGNPWEQAEGRIKAAKVTSQQVQVAWIKLANKGPSGDLAEHGKRLQKDTLAVVQNAKARFPNLRVVYLGSRIYGGYSSGRLNPEPYAYEGAFAARWLIQDQIKGDAALNYDAERGAVKAPLLLWGPYLWADGVTPRKSDGLIYERKDLANDGVHPSISGRQKVADQLLRFFKNDANARLWFAKK